MPIYEVTLSNRNKGKGRVCKAEVRSERPPPKPNLHKIPNQASGMGRDVCQSSFCAMHSTYIASLACKCCFWALFTLNLNFLPNSARFRKGEIGYFSHMNHQNHQFCFSYSMSHYLYEKKQRNWQPTKSFERLTVYTWTGKGCSW